MNMILLALLGLVVVCLALIWTDPKSARYVADICWRRARAVEAARKAYRHAWNVGVQYELDIKE